MGGYTPTITHLHVYIHMYITAVLQSELSPDIVVGSIVVHVAEKHRIHKAGNGGVNVSEATDHQGDAVIQIAADVGLFAVGKCFR